MNTFAERYGIAFPLISDTGGKLKSLYSTRRINYLIDKKGVVQMIQGGIPENGRFIRKLKAMEE